MIARRAVSAGVSVASPRWYRRQAIVTASSFRSAPDVAETPGVLAFLAETLYRRGINCLETVSVHTDSIFVFRDRDVIGAYQVLSELVEPPSLAERDEATVSASRGQHR